MFRNSYLKISLMILILVVFVVAITVSTQIILRKLYPDGRLERLTVNHDEFLKRLESIEDTQRNPFNEAIARVRYAIVHVSVTYNKEGVRKRGRGSGIVIDKTNGYILTNYHVIEDAAYINIIFPHSDPRHDIAMGYPTSIIGYDPLSDLAVLKKSKIPTKETFEIEWGDSENVQVGEQVIGVGYPHALARQANPTVTAGIISATGRNFLKNRLHVEMIQTDASINSGNSGGALVNIHGKLIGINTFIRTISGGSEGIGFAIPANTAKKVSEQLIEHGCVIPPYLGIHTLPVTQDLVKAKKLPRSPFLLTSSYPGGPEDDGQRNYAGVYVSSIDQGSPADNAGIKPGDLIYSKVRESFMLPEEPGFLRHKGPNIESERHFKSMTRILPIHQKTTFSIARDGTVPIMGEPNMNIIMKDKNGELRSAGPLNVELEPEVLQWDYTPPRWGIILKQPNREESKKYKHRGVIVKSITPESALGTTFRPGDLIYKIVSKAVIIVDKKKKPFVEEEIHSLETFTINLPMFTPGEQFWFHFERNNESTSELVTIPKD